MGILAELQCLIWGVEWHESALDSFRCATESEEGDQSTHRLPDELMTALATLADNSELGAAWAALEAVRRLAVEAQHTGARLYLWNSTEF